MTDDGKRTENIVPAIDDPPTITRDFHPHPWHRPRKQFVRRHQWNYYLENKVIQERAATGLDDVIRILGLPSFDFLDLLSLQEICEKHNKQIGYLGFNSQYEADPKQPIDLYNELQQLRVLDTSSYIHQSSELVADRFEQVAHDGTVPEMCFKRFPHYDMVNLDLCGCIIDPNENRATDCLAAISKMLSRQTTTRVAPWLLFVTSFAHAEQVNLDAFQLLCDALKNNAERDAEFGRQFSTQFGVDAVDVRASTEAGNVEDFLGVFSTAFGKWLAGELHDGTPPSLVEMLPGYQFRHKDFQDPMLVSLGYLITPKPRGGDDDGKQFSKSYARAAIKIVQKSAELKDLDTLLGDDAELTKQMATETCGMLVGCGYDEGEVRKFLDI